jgi:Uri superfamily endonuclease
VKARDSGAYCLLIRLDRAAEATIGRLGRFRFPAGYYVYCGSAARGLGARTARHQRGAKTIHWHIDYLLALPEARLVACVPYPSERRRECEFNGSVQRQRGARVPVPGFGSSDCRAGCPAHLTHFRQRPRLPSRKRYNVQVVNS